MYRCLFIFLKNWNLKLILLIILIIISLDVFSKSFEKIITFKEPITPFCIVPLYLEVPPLSVRTVEIDVELIPKTSDRVVKKNNSFFMKHCTHSPILKDNDGNYLCLIHFLWLFDSEFIECFRNMEKSEKEECLGTLPRQLKLSYHFDEPLFPYTALMQIKQGECLDDREVIWYCDDICEEKKKAIHQNDCAVIFIHGIQSLNYCDMLDNLKKDTYTTWRNIVLKKYWEHYSILEDTDFYEFNYDTYFLELEGYGEILCEMLENSGLLDQYERIFLISHSMGSIVANYAMNTHIKKSSEYLGNRIEQNIMISSALEGTYLVNLTDYLLQHVSQQDHLNLYNSYDQDKDDDLFWCLLQIINGDYNLLLQEDIFSGLFDDFFDFYREYPMIAGVILSSIDGVSLFGGIAPFDGITSLRYTDKEFLLNLERAMGFEEKTFMVNNALNMMNINDQFSEKRVLFTSYIENTDEFISKAIFLLKFLKNRINLSDNGDGVSGFSSTVLGQYIIHRILSCLMSVFAESSGNYDHILNNGYISLWSGTLSGHPWNLKSENCFIIKDLDHLQLLNSDIVIQKIKSIVEQ